MPRTIKEALEQQLNGFYIGQRLILPFRCQIIKLITKDEIFTEFVGGKDIKISQDPQNTSIYFRHMGRLQSFLGDYGLIKMVVAEWDADLTDPHTHIKIIVELQDNHVARIAQPDNDILFIK